MRCGRKEDLKEIPSGSLPYIRLKLPACDNSGSSTTRRCSIADQSQERCRERLARKNSPGVLKNGIAKLRGLIRLIVLRRPVHQSFVKEFRQGQTM